MEKIKVAKFGGTSVADANQFRKVKAIVEADKRRRYVVVSAPGKRHGEDNKITDLLYLCHAHIKYSVPFDQVFDIICDRYVQIVKELDIDLDIKFYLEEIRSNMTKNISIDYLVSRGEYLNALIMAKFLNYDFIDAKEVIYFDNNGAVDIKRTEEVMSKVLANHDYAVIPGFYGSSPDGKIKIFSRGGSDITGALIARVSDADIYENWTDVSGFLMADPRIVDNPKPIERITYRELRELSYMGASVLHEDAIFPVRDVGIPINIRNTNDSDNPGTIITSEVSKDSSNKIITGIAGKKDFTVISIYKNHMNSEIGFVRKILSIMEMNDITFEHIPSGIDSVSIVISDSQLDGKLNIITDEINKKCHPDSLNVYTNMALIATVGNNMAYTPGISAKLFTALGNEGINIRMIDQGSSEINIIVGVEDKDFKNAIKAIYNAFVV
ncbi:aspartate kinase [Paramaledivibacter caminithermalis]|jgi:aspartate kinase|uniref:Aspartokinase n=1 Tax=Paramaledivibacter caminithermalis (strain DSM 15212 / CIP 107654 / DViRD3) TaxID=1121301 RepID=A0A1M6LNV1_PARC5|nr:aspartate kinase [Paramaledivibacter caminithermalis]SHJ72897.1 aspartate kinase [Paramaledivibacter caminithermalis DSM 15212]